MLYLFFLLMFILFVWKIWKARWFYLILLLEASLYLLSLLLNSIIFTLASTLSWRRILEVFNMFIIGYHLSLNIILLFICLNLYKISWQLFLRGRSLYFPGFLWRIWFIFIISICLLSCYESFIIRRSCRLSWLIN